MLRAGLTHDIVIHVNNSQTLGLIAKTGTYRVTNAPTFVPRFTVGDPKGLDYTRWASFVQDDFSGGAGLYTWDGQVGPNRFAESTFIDIGLQPFRVARPAQALKPGAAEPFVPEEKAGAAGAVAPALVPVATTGFVGTRFSALYPVFAIAYSGIPHIFHGRGTILHTNVSPLGFQSGVKHYAFSGRWVPDDASVLASPILSATAFSTCVAAALGSHGIRIYGAQPPPGLASWRTPAYSTVASRLISFDAKLWRTWQNAIASLTPTAATNFWSPYIEVGDATQEIVAAIPFNGRLYLGRRDSLWAWEAGRVYEVYNFKDLVDPSNCNVLISHRGAIYFNVREVLYRLTLEGTIETVPMIPFVGMFVDAVSLGDELYFSVEAFNEAPRFLKLNTITGASTQWFYSPEIGMVSNNRYLTQKHLPTVRLAQQLGFIHLAPFAVTGAGALTSVGSTSTAPVIAVVDQRSAAAEQLSPYFYKHGRNCYLTTARLTFGLQGLDKVIGRIKVFHNLSSLTDRIRVYYQINPELPRLVAVWRTGTVLVDDTNYAGILSDNRLPRGVVDDSGPTANYFGEFGLVGDSASHYGELYFGFDRPVVEFDYNLAAEYPEGGLTIGGNPFTGGGNLLYWNGSAWALIPPWRIRYDTGGNINVPGPIDGAMWHSFRRDGTFRIDEEAIRDWQPTTVKGVTAYYLQYDGFSFYQEVPAFTEIAPSLRNLNEQHFLWQLLGEVSGLGPRTSVLEFPRGTTAKSIQLKFEFLATDRTRPILYGYEVEYLPVGPNHNLIDVGVVVMGLNDIKRLDGAVENSGAHIHATLWSLNWANVPYVVQLPYPPPIGHTRSMLVKIADPGVAVPILSYGHTNFVGTEIPLRLQEL